MGCQLGGVAQISEWHPDMVPPALYPPTSRRHSSESASGMVSWETHERPNGRVLGLMKYRTRFLAQTRNSSRWLRDPSFR
jgi:hypothetical protein